MKILSLPIHGEILHLLHRHGPCGDDVIFNVAQYIITHAMETYNSGESDANLADYIDVKYTEGGELAEFLNAYSMYVLEAIVVNQIQTPYIANANRQFFTISEL